MLRGVSKRETGSASPLRHSMEGQLCDAGPHMIVTGVFAYIDIWAGDS